MQKIGLFLNDFRRKEPLGFLALCMIIFMALSVVVLPFIFSMDPYSNCLEMRLQAPSKDHLLGTDQVGRDVLARIVYGGRVSFIIGILTTLITFFIGVSLGLLAGIRGGTLDVVVTQMVDISFAVPSLLLAIAAAAILPPGMLTIIIALTLSGWGSFARIARSSAKQLITRDYVLAARALGTDTFKLLMRHILPNSLSVLIITSTLKMGSFILSEAALSFLGLGIRPPTPSWGSMVSESYRFLSIQPWLSVFPGIMIALLVMSFNLLGDSLRDFYDVRKDV